MTCFDETAGSQLVEKTTGEATINITFVDAADTCTETPLTTMTTMAILSSTTGQGVEQQQPSDPVYFFHKPENIVALSIAGGLLVGIPIGIGMHIVAKRCTCK